MTTIIDGRFEVTGEAGSGGMGTVYHGIDRRTREPVAIKVLRGKRPADQARFAREVELLGRLDDPNIVRYIAHGVTPRGEAYLAMEWVEGDTLTERLRDTGLTVAETVTLARTVAAALATAHAHNLLHRDVKPGNIVFAQGDIARAKVIDFGIARTMDGSPGVTETGVAVGTPSYMAPEQIRCERDLDARADVFALGCVLYEALTGRETFHGQHVLAVYSKILFWDPARPRTLNPDVPPELDDLVGRMLAKPRENRPADGAAVLAELARIHIDHPGERRPCRSQDPPTYLLDNSEESRCATVVAVPADIDAAPTLAPEAVAERRGELQLAVAGLGARVEQCVDGAVVAALARTTSEEDLVDRAARTALVLRRIMPDTLIAVSSGSASQDTAVRAVAQEALTSVFTGGKKEGPPLGAIRIDERGARLLGDGFRRILRNGTYYFKEDVK